MGARDKHLPDRPIIEHCIREWMIRQWHDDPTETPTLTTLAAQAHVQPNTIYSIVNSDAEISEATFIKLGRVLNRLPQSLWVNPAPKIPVNDKVHHLVDLLVEMIGDNKIHVEIDPATRRIKTDLAGEFQDLRRQVLLGDIHELRSWPVSVNDWEEVFLHLRLRGHVYVGFRGEIGIATANTRDFAEIVKVREQYECFLAELFTKRPAHEQEIVIADFNAAVAECQKVRNDQRRFVDAEVRSHLCWARGNSTIRDAFAILLKRSRQIADQLIILKSFATKIQDRDYRADMKDMPGDLEEIVGSLHVGMTDATDTKRLICAHTERLHSMVDELKELTISRELANVDKEASKLRRHRRKRGATASKVAD